MGNPVRALWIVPTFGPRAQFGDLTATGLVEVSRDAACLQEGGRWAVALGFEGDFVFARFQDWSREQVAGVEWKPPTSSWHSSLDRQAYESGVHRIKEHIGAGWVYQVNLCRILTAECAEPGLDGLYQRIRAMGGAFAGLLELPDHGVSIASASPERFLTRTGGSLLSSPIKGTADHPTRFLAKDRAENIMIVDLVRNDLGRVAATGSVAVKQLLAVEPYPGLFHLVSTVSAEASDSTWQQILSATMPPGSVSGAPKHSALEVIAEIEPVPRQWYCGAFGWIDADMQRAELGVAIRTFWREDGLLKFGTGAGITWGSDPAGEWHETELKAQRLIGLAEAET